jgi:hypothetical protein
MNGKSTYTIVPPSTRARAVQDEWGLYDPNQAGIKAAIRAVRALNTPTLTDIVPDQRVADIVPESRVRDFKPEARARDIAPELPVREIALEPPMCETAPEPEVRDLTSEVTAAPAPDEEMYKLDVAEPELEPEAEQATPKTADRGAVYTLEFPTRCPQCCKKISTVRVSRLLRTQVSFTSTLPRKGYIIVCPECDGMVSAELSGLI